VHETKELDIEDLIPWCLPPWSMVRCLIPRSLMLGLRSNAMISLSGHFFLGLGFLCFQKGALRTNMPT
jgi:hypothetical protein